MTNTNYHIAFDRMFARGASYGIDAAYSNPAGLAWTSEGWQLSFNWQSPQQNRDITTTTAMLQPMYGSATHKFEGKATAPFVPALFAVYKHDNWAISSMIGIVGSGGFVEYKEGVPMFNVVLASMLAAKGITPDQYTLNSQMKGKQYIYGGQVNFTYKILENVSAAVGIRANYYDGYYKGHVIADQHPILGDLAKLQLDVDQKGWGFTPLVSIDYHKGPLTLSARYEFRTKLNIPNTQNELVAEPGANLASMLMKTDPASLKAIGDALQAKMANNRQDELTHGTHEVLAGVEYDINKMFTVSAGGQRTDYGLSDKYQTNTSFACDSYSVGFGAAVNLNEHIRLNASYFCTLYSDYTVNTDNYLQTGMAGKDVYSRTNGVFGVGIDYKF